MLCKEITTSNFPLLHPEDKVSDVLQQSHHTGILYFPVANDEELIGVLPLNEITEMPVNTSIAELQHIFIKISVPENEHFISALKILELTDSNILPVIDNEHKYLGVITQTSLLDALAILLDVENNNGGLIVLEMSKIEYSFSEISRIVESTDANILQLNSYFDVKTELFIVTIRVSRNNVSEIVNALQRHDYHIAYFVGEELYENEIKRNYDALMNYLNI
ncbi:hypothetical protein A9P82_14290 [Arachidicoccus ginsenosidimutans]|uniref:CBS domain-containing protein n=1 Tax=Arachidicoccus sp. BS20 TaxID=1850526 RepID=UPI0007F17139|nr:CBS domain-containing protein [Arachidicoccus sp. BS20]ANI90355.1 hypothetical protein A9P82_14290 [Arachidicoccus sp. BS20]